MPLVTEMLKKYSKCSDLSSASHKNVDKAGRNALNSFDSHTRLIIEEVIQISTLLPACVYLRLLCLTGSSDRAEHGREDSGHSYSRLKNQIHNTCSNPQKRSDTTRRRITMTSCFWELACCVCCRQNRFTTSWPDSSSGHNDRISHSCFKMYDCDYL